MSKETQSYIEYMKAMYLEIMKKDKIDLIDYSFLKIYQKTIDSTIIIPKVEKEI